MTGWRRLSLEILSLLPLILLLRLVDPSTAVAEDAGPIPDESRPESASTERLQSADPEPSEFEKAEREGVPEMVVSATRKATPISELTRAVTVLNSEELEVQTRISRSLSEIISKNVPGFSPSTEALTDFGQTLRGRTFLTLIDGVPQSTPLRDGRRSLNSVDGDLVERVEVVRGGTAVYGFGATGGLIQILTREPDETPFNAHSELGFELSTQQFGDDSFAWNTQHRVSGKSENVGYVLAGGFTQRNGR